MFEGRIDSIFNYCDRWCERCAFTDRCSVFATEAAVAMCGDTREAFELVFGEPHPVGEPRPRPEPAHLALLAACEDHEEEEPRAKGEEDEGDDADPEGDDKPIDPLETQSREYTTLAFQWTREHRERWHERGDAVLRDALDVVSWDATLIGGKIHRALSGRALLAEDDDEDPVQNDANGSAKVALLSLERSEAGWALIAEATGDIEAAALGRLAWALRQAFSREFPAAMAFVRPGFDE